MAPWIENNYPLEEGPITYTHRNLSNDNYEFKLNEDNVIKMDRIDEISKIITNSGAFEILDGRPVDRFNGVVPEPRPGVRSGNILGSKNVFFKDLVNEDWTYKSDEELKKIFQNAKVNLESDIVTSCGSGLTAAMINLSLTLIGKEQMKLYDGAWTEYGSRPE